MRLKAASDLAEGRRDQAEGYRDQAEGFRDLELSWY